MNWIMERESELGMGRDAYEADAVDFHRLFGELACDLYEIFSNLNGEPECH